MNVAPTPSLTHELALIALAAAVLAALAGMLRLGALHRYRPGAVRNVLGLLMLWQAMMVALALAGYFAVFSEPWRALPTVALSIAGAAWLATRTTALHALQGIPAWTWPALQSFRLPLELLLYHMYAQGVIGKPMTFSGYNFDILVGVSAPLMAIWLWAQPDSSRVQRLSVLWNLAGLALLLNILTIAFLSIPFPFQALVQEPANRMVAAFPFIWLATLFVPLALFAHLIALRSARQERTERKTASKRGVHP
ncbi:MAG: hypothetical protein JNL19_03840 [Burkholderiales bacterium]|nr:hypothetical protein [Burkholderiales bacterium]